MSAFWLSLHVAYQCRDTGVCCTAGWPVPVGHAEASAIDDAVARGALGCRDGRADWLVPHADAPPDAAGLFRRTSDGACVFHRAGACGCTVHRSLGHAALPATCQHFPRVCLVDDRGVHVTLSHACPTAAAMLVAHEGPVAIVEGPPPVPSRLVPEGLDARDAIPPLLSPRVAMDLPGLAAWEAHAVARLAGPAASGQVDASVSRLLDEAATLARWTPQSGTTLVEAVAGLPEVSWSPRPALADGVWERADAVRAACPEAWSWPAWDDSVREADRLHVGPAWADSAPVVRRFLAAHAFASWAAWQGIGPLAVAGSVVLARDVLRAEAARATARDGGPLDAARLRRAVQEADRLLRHHADPRPLAALASRVASRLVAEGRVS